MLHGVYTRLKSLTGRSASGERADDADAVDALVAHLIAEARRNGIDVDEALVDDYKAYARLRFTAGICC
ncbi:MAG: hypothetical protein AAGA28_14510 [Pseudomonadota bacterium]